MRIPCGTAFPPKCRFRDEQICQNERDAVARFTAYQVQAELEIEGFAALRPDEDGEGATSTDHPGAYQAL